MELTATDQPGTGYCGKLSSYSTGGMSISLCTYIPNNFNYLFIFYKETKRSKSVGFDIKVTEITSELVGG